MAQIAELRMSKDSQLMTSRNLTTIARDLIALRQRLEAEGREADAVELRRAVDRLLDQAEKLNNSALLTGRAMVDAIRNSW